MRAVRFCLDIHNFYLHHHARTKIYSVQPFMSSSQLTKNTKKILIKSFSNQPQGQVIFRKVFFMGEEGRKQAQNKFTDGKSCEVINFNKTSLLEGPRDYK